MLSTTEAYNGNEADGMDLSDVDVVSSDLVDEADDENDVEMEDAVQHETSKAVPRRGRPPKSSLRAKASTPVEVRRRDRRQISAKNPTPPLNSMKVQKRNVATRRSAAEASAKGEAGSRHGCGTNVDNSGDGGKKPKKDKQKQRGVTERRGSSEEWEVEGILDSLIEAGTHRHFYLVKWKGFASKHNTWEPKANLANCGAAIEAFQRKK